MQHNALVERVPKHATGVQMSRTPGIERARNDVASEAAAGYRPVDLVVISNRLLTTRRS